MERERLICCLVGKFVTLDPSITSQDLRIKIDQYLLESNLTGLGTEPNDIDLLQDLLDETMISVLGSGINRKNRRMVKN